jgi:hypothetical protein
MAAGMELLKLIGFGVLLSPVGFGLWLICELVGP